MTHMPIVVYPRWMVNRFSQEEITAAKLRRLKKQLLKRKARREAMRAVSNPDVESTS